MPTYEYCCRQCGQQFTKMMTLSQHGRRSKPACPKCDSRQVEQRPASFQAVTSKKG